MMAVFIQRQHLNRNVARARILLEVIEDRPTQHVRQENVQRNCRRMEFVSQRQRFRSACRDENLESAIVRQIAKQRGKVRIVFDDQQNGIVGLKFSRSSAMVICSIARLDADLLLAGARWHRRRFHFGPANSRGRTDISLRQIERERAALVRARCAIEFRRQAGWPVRG